MKKKNQSRKVIIVVIVAALALLLAVIYISTNSNQQTDGVEAVSEAESRKTVEDPNYNGDLPTFEAGDEGSDTKSQ